MDNKKIPTSYGTVIILIIAVTVGWFVWEYENNQQAVEQLQTILPTNKSAIVKVPTGNQGQKEDTGTSNSLSNTWHRYVSKDKTFSIEYPGNWLIDGSVFSDGKGNKIAEFSPGIIMLQTNQKCLSELKDDGTRTKIISRKNIIINKRQGVLVKSEVINDMGGGTWFPNTYCVYGGTKAFVMSFYDRDLNSSNKDMYDKIISTLEFEKQ